MANISESKYPSASEIPELNNPAEGAPEGAAQNPVLGYLQGLQTFVLALEKENPDAASKVKQSFITLLDDISAITGGRGVPAMEQTTPEATPAPAATPAGTGKEMPMNSSQTAKPVI